MLRWRDLCLQCLLPHCLGGPRCHFCCSHVWLCDFHGSRFVSVVALPFTVPFPHLHCNGSSPFTLALCISCQPHPAPFPLCPHPPNLNPTLALPIGLPHRNHSPFVDARPITKWESWPRSNKHYVCYVLSLCGRCFSLVVSFLVLESVCFLSFIAPRTPRSTEMDRPSQDNHPTKSSFIPRQSLHPYSFSVTIIPLPSPPLLRKINPRQCCPLCAPCRHKFFLGMPHVPHGSPAQPRSFSCGSLCTPSCPNRLMPGQHQQLYAFHHWNGGTDLWCSGEWSYKGQWWAVWWTPLPKDRPQPYLPQFPNI